jgi:osmoprotectant transport system permease protein
VVKVGSKNFTESIVLAHVVGRTIADAGGQPVVKPDLGGSLIVWGALRKGDIDVYVDYTGTLAQVVLAGKNLKNSSPRALREALDQEGFRISDRLGFNNSYALGMREDVAARLGVRSISDLRKHPGLKFRVSEEFYGRADGWPGLRNHYRLETADVRGMDHVAAMQAVADAAADVTDVYTTDAEINKHQLRVLADDRRFFPRYDAVVVYRKDLAPEMELALLDLEGKIDDVSMIEMNERATIDLVEPARVADEFAARLKQAPPPKAETTSEWVGRMLAGFLVRTGEHLLLVIVSLTLAMVAALPLGVLAFKQPAFGEVILAGTGVVQTIPSLAILVLMIPLFGLGVGPAVAALFLYSLLPIVRSTCTGLRNIPGHLGESALALGLGSLARLRLVELPLATPSILAGIKTAAVINVGTATIGALIGAGGYGGPIITGLRLNNLSLILQGAIPAALLAVLMQTLFGLAERLVVPRGLLAK